MCFCHDYFRDVYNKFADGMTIDKKVPRLTESRDGHEKNDGLFAALSMVRPDQMNNVIRRLMGSSG